MLTRLLIVWMACSGAGLAWSSDPVTPSAASLRAKYAALGERLRNNPFKRALSIDSVEVSDALKGDIYALVDYPFATVSSALNGPEDWCDVLILHINIKYCRASPDKAILKVSLGKKYAQPLEDAYAIEFSYRVIAAGPEHLAIRLNAGKGPLSTRDYHIQLQAVPVENGRTFIHLSFSNSYGLLGQLAMRAYLVTIGREKVGFTVTGRQSDGQPEYIGGMRGVVERNTMRYYLAIDAHLSASTAPPALKFQKRLETWFNATEEYPRQLREVSRTAYFDMKRSEYLRQQIVP